MSRSTIHREPCSDTREGVGEASVAARVGRVLSAETDMFRMCRGSSHGRRQYRVRRYGEAQPDIAASETPCTHVHPAPGPGRSSGRPIGQPVGPHREGVMP